MKRKRRKTDGKRRRIPRPLLAILGLAAVGVVATVLSSRRIQPLEDWDDLLDDDEGPGGRDAFPSTSVWIDGPAGALHVDDGGSGGLPVLFVHGLGGAAGQWQAQLDRLRPERRALALDLRGHGRSEASGSGEYGVSAYADDVAAAVAELDLDAFVLVGHSLGGSVAIEVAARLPERVAGLVLVDPNGDQTRIPRRELDAFLRTLAGDPTGEMRSYFKQLLIAADPEAADRVLADLAAVPPEAFALSLESAFGFSPVEALKNYPGPRISVVSDHNTLPYSLHNLLPDLPVRLISGTSHWLMMDRPDDLDRVLGEFLAGLRRAG